jgi:S-DNA-T family DNA segregation ATPase FtsK/SpoIIIE
MYYVGPGVFIFLGVLAWVLGANLFGREISQIALRTVGMILLLIAVSTSVYMLFPSTAGGFPDGNGGVIGIATGNFLTHHIKPLGTFFVLLGAWCVGAVLLADVVVLSVVRWCGMGIGKMLGFAMPAWSAARERSQSLSDIWSRLYTRQSGQPVEEDDEYEYEYEEEDSQEYDNEIEAITEEEASDKSLSKKDKKKLRRAKAKAKEKAKLVPAQKQPKPYVPKSYEDYELPPISLLQEPQYGFAAVQSKMVRQKSQTLEGLLSEFGVNAKVVSFESGPAITMYELELAPGIKVSQIANLSNDMARALGAGSVRVVAPLPGRHTIGIEAPNSQREIVRLKELLEKAGSKPGKMAIPLFLGKSSSGEVLVSDLAAMPHCLIAGTTGSGKSVCINSIITSILLTRRPDEVKLVLVDPKMVEMAAFDTIPHLMCPIVTEVKRAENILEWATTKMDERYELLAEAKVRNIASYNKLTQEEIIKRFNPSTPEEEAKIPKKLPYMVIIIDELADLMMTSAKEIESFIVRIAQKSRAVGIHLVLATQRPQATVVTGLIKSNMPARIGFRVAARMDSRIILDQNGAETLLGQGDMLFLKPGTSDLVRSQGAFLDDEEINDIVDHLKTIAAPQFHPELMQLNTVDLTSAPKDDLFDDAVRVVLETKRGSVSLLQRRLSIGYARASRIIETMAATGLLGEYKGSQAREVTMTLAEYDAMKKQMVADEVAGYADLSDDFDEDDDTDDLDSEEYENATEEIDDDEEYEEEDGEEEEYEEEDDAEEEEYEDEEEQEYEDEED